MTTNTLEPEGAWYLDDSNMSMDSADFRAALPLPTLSGGLSFDSALDSSKQGIPLAMKGLNIDSHSKDHMFTASNSQSRKRKHFDDFDADGSESMSNKKWRTETGSKDFKDMLNITTVPHSVGDPFLLHKGEFTEVLGKGQFNFSLGDPKEKNEHENFIPFQTITETKKTNPINSHKKFSFSEIVAGTLKSRKNQQHQQQNSPQERALFDVEMSPSAKPLKPISAFTLTSIDIKNNEKKSWAEMCLGKEKKVGIASRSNTTSETSEKSDVSPSESGSSVTAASADNVPIAPQSLQSNFANLILSDENVILINKEKKPEKVEPEKVEHKEGEKENNVKVNKGPRTLSPEERKQRRFHQIELGKDTEGYKNYLKLIPRQQRRRKDPETPDWTDVTTGKRRFDGMVRNWRRRLHEYDDLTSVKKR